MTRDLSVATDEGCISLCLASIAMMGMGRGVDIRWLFRSAGLMVPEPSLMSPIRWWLLFRCDGAGACCDAEKTLDIVQSRMGEVAAGR
jgi:hypothetical protein